MTLHPRHTAGRIARRSGRRVTPIALLSAMLSTASATFAGGLTVTVVDAAGKPLPDAVAMLEPASGQASVKPMPDAEIKQAKRQFAPRVTVVTAGTRISFPNFDTVRHQVYSFSAIKTFELKLYAGMPSAPVTFDKPGIAVLGCNIHDSMAAWVVVTDTPWFAQSGANGRARIESVPPGSYRLRVWHAGLAINVPPADAPVTIGTADAEMPMRLPVSDLP